MSKFKVFAKEFRTVELSVEVLVEAKNMDEATKKYLEDDVIESEIIDFFVDNEASCDDPIVQSVCLLNEEE